MTVAQDREGPAVIATAQDDGFTYVTRAPRPGKARKARRRGPQGSGSDVVTSPEERLKQRIAIVKTRKEELLRQPELKEFTARLPRVGVVRSDDRAGEDSQVQELTTAKYGNAMALGLGSVKDARSAQIQLALFLIMCDQLTTSKIASGKLKMSAFDPICDEEDDALFEALGIEPLKENQRGHYELQEKTFVYMPHCPRALYENLLRSNWSPTGFGNLVLCCNELERYATGIAAADKSSLCIQKIVPHLQVLPVPAMTDVAGNALNDLAVQTFAAPIASQEPVKEELDTLQEAMAKLNVQGSGRQRRTPDSPKLLPKRSLPDDFWTLSSQDEAEAKDRTQVEVL